MAHINKEDVCVYLVGAGPGDLGLMTLRAHELLVNADVVVYDYLTSGDIMNLFPKDAECIYVGKKGFERHITQDEINQILIDKAYELAESIDKDDASRTKPLSIVRLKGGDPFVFGRGGEEAYALSHAGVAFEVVPGITSGIAAPAYAGIPVTSRGFASAVTFVTGNEDPTKNETSIAWGALAELIVQGGTVCFYMGMRNLASICSRLVAKGCDPETSVGMVRWGTNPEQRTVVATLATALEEATKAELTAPVMIIVGKVVELRKDLAWFEDRPLFGKSVLVTRARAQASGFAKRLASLGAKIVEFPVIEIGEPDDPSILDEALNNLSKYDTVVFTSANGVERFFERLQQIGAPESKDSEIRRFDSRVLGLKNIVAIGPATKQALQERGIVADVMPERFVAESTIEALNEHGLVYEGAQILIPRAQVAREILPETLRSQGCIVDVAPAYKTRLPLVEDAGDMRAALANGEVDAVTFTSSSTVKNLMHLLGDDAKELLGSVDLFSIGPITSKTLSEFGFDSVYEATEYTTQGLIDEMRRVYNVQQ